jgi:SOS response regulatory protein OraA/RecX
MKAKKRLSDFLLRRGFSWEIVSEVLEQWKDLNNDKERYEE